MCEYRCIVFIDFMIKGKSFSDYTNFSLLVNMKKYDKTR